MYLLSSDQYTGNWFLFVIIIDWEDAHKRYRNHYEEEEERTFKLSCSLFFCLWWFGWFVFCLDCVEFWSERIHYHIREQYYLHRFVQYHHDFFLHFVLNGIPNNSLYLVMRHIQSRSVGISSLHSWFNTTLTKEELYSPSWSESLLYDRARSPSAWIRDWLGISIHSPSILKIVIRY